jgi:hypothetical protein
VEPQASNDTQTWALLITDGTLIEFPIEIYTSHSSGIREAERWAWILAGSGEIRIDRPCPDRWQVGVRDVRLVPCGRYDFNPDSEWWIGVHWTVDGYPDPEAKLLAGRETARSWVLEEPIGEVLVSSHEQEWSMSATFSRGVEASHSTASLAKVVTGPSGVESPPRAEYQVELTGTFVQGISSTIVAQPGLSRADIEELVERNWAELSAESHVLLESSWELERYEELPLPGERSP